MGTLGNRLRNLRESQGLTQQEVADALNCNCKAISNYELDKREPDFSILLKLCDFFDVTADYLLGRTEFPKTYKQMPLTSQTVALIQQFNKLPDNLRQDVLRYIYLNLLDVEKTGKSGAQHAR